MKTPPTPPTVLYMDSHAQCPLLPEAREAMVAALGCPGNPTATHPAGKRARAILEAARREVALSAGARPEDVIFTSSATEANNQAIRSALAAAMERGVTSPNVVTTNIEHSSVLELLGALAARGLVEVRMVPVDRRGFVDAEAVALAIDDRTALVTVMGANNEIGTVQPVAAIAARLPSGVPFHSDAAQSFARVEGAPFESGPVLTVSSQKVGGPVGIAALVVPPRHRHWLRAYLLGGKHEAGLRAGTENHPAAAGFGAACRAMRAAWPLGHGRDEGARLHVRRHRDMLLEALLERLGPLVTINGAIDDPRAPLSVLRLPQNLNVGIEGVCPVSLHEAIRDRLCVSAAAACRQTGKDRSHVLAAIGASESGASVRFGLTARHDEACVREAARIVAEAALALEGVGCPIHPAS